MKIKKETNQTNLNLNYIRNLPYKTKNKTGCGAAPLLLCSSPQIIKRVEKTKQTLLNFLRFIFRLSVKQKQKIILLLFKIPIIVVAVECFIFYKIYIVYYFMETKN